MVERLKQIWGGFEQSTTRKLTGRGVENIVMPQRAAERAQPAAAPDKAGVEAPSEAAFAALRAKLGDAEKKFAKRRPREGASHDARGGAPSADLADAPEAARDLIRGLAATEARIARGFREYDTSMKAPEPRKKKIFGLF